MSMNTINDKINNYFLFLLRFGFITLLIFAQISESATNEKIQADSSFSTASYGLQSSFDRPTMADIDIDPNSKSPLNSNGERVGAIKEQIYSGELHASFFEFLMGSHSGNDIDIERLIFEIVKLAFDGDGNKVLPSLELVDFLQRVVDLSKYSTVTTLDFFLAFISKDGFETNIKHDLKRLQDFSEYISYLIKYNGEPTFNHMLKYSKETLSSIKTRVHSSIWWMEELMNTGEILEYEYQNSMGKTVYSSQPIIGEIVNEINSNEPRAVLSYKLTKQALFDIFGTNMNRAYSKLKRLYGKIIYLQSNKKKVLSPNLLYSIYLSIVIISDLYYQGLSSNILSPGIIFMVLLRDDIEHFPANWEERLTNNGISFGVNELNIKIKDNKYKNPESIILDVSTNEGICNASVIRSHINDVLKKYGIEYFHFMNTVLNRYKTFFFPIANKQFNRETHPTVNPKDKWFLDISELVMEMGVTRTIGFIDEYHLLEISLSRSNLSSAIIVGESILIKRSLVEYLALRIINGNSAANLRGFRVIQLNFDSLLETCISSKMSIMEQIRMKLDELLEIYGGKVIIFTDDLFSSFETPIGSKRLHDVLKHYIISGTLKVIGSLSDANYEYVVEKDYEVRNLFNKIKVDQLSGIVSELFISGLRYQLELSAGIFINNDVIRTSVIMCSKYVENCILPDDAIELIKSSIAMARNEQFLNFPSAISGIEDYISHSRTGIHVSRIRDYEYNSTTELNRSRLLETLRMNLRMKNTIMSLSLKIKPYMAKFRYLKTQLYFMMHIYTAFPVVCKATSEENELKILEEREKIIPIFSDELSVSQLTNIYRKNLLKYKQTNNKSYDESINDVVSAVTESQLDPQFFDNIHLVIKEKQNEVASMKSLILEMAFNYNSLYSPLGMGEIDASHIAFIVSERYGKSINKLLDEVEYRKLPENIKDRISEILSKYVIGQNVAIDYVSFHLGAEMFRDNKNSPRCLILVGPAGSGKKTFAIALQTTLIESKMLFFDFSYDITLYSHLKTLNSREFSDIDSSKRLLGDNQSTGIIPDSLRQSSSTVFLFEDIEDAHPEVIRLILDIIQNKDNINQKVGALGKCTFILTTKIGSEIIVKNPDQIDTIKVRINVIKKLRETFGSGFARVIQNIVLLKPFTKDETVKILGINFSEYSASLKKNYNITLIQPTMSTLNRIVDMKYSPELGYKPILDYFEKDIKEKVVQFIKKGILKKNTTFKLSIRNNVSSDDTDELLIDFTIVKGT
ncbi:ClpB ATPase [Cryptosporidium canis]|nr:ClpB ATPase [Cryptosporidium canis]